MCEERMRLRRSLGFVLGRVLISKMRDAALVDHGKCTLRLVVHCAVQLYQRFCIVLHHRVPAESAPVATCLHRHHPQRLQSDKRKGTLLRLYLSLCDAQQLSTTQISMQALPSKRPSFSAFDGTPSFCPSALFYIS